MTTMSKKAVLGCGAGLMALALATGAWAQQRTFDIPAQEATKAVPEFARQAGVQIIAPGSQLRGLRTKAVSGQLDARAALAAMLEGTGLMIASDDGATIMLRKGPARPQDLAAVPPAREEPEQVSEIVVTTGSRIRGQQPTAPVHVVDRKDIDQSGFSQVGDLMRSLPQNFSGGQNPGVQPTTTEGSANLSNASTVNLRGIGPDATLVLFNGHRLAGDTQSPAPDISAVPLAALKRVEVVTDGASALYGSDAVAGVVNFIVRSDYAGEEISTRLGVATQGGGFEQTYNVLAGRTWSGGNILGGIEYLHQDPVLASDRRVTADAGPSNTLLAGQERTSLYVSGQQSLSSVVTLKFDGLYMNRSADQVIEYSPGGYAEASALSVTSFLVAPSVTFDLSDDWEASVEGALSRSANTRDSLSNFGDVNVSETRNGAKTVEANANGSLFTLPTGAVRLAVGAGHRKEDQRIWSTASAERVGERNISYLFGELFVPLVAPSAERPGLRQFDLSIATRYEDYSDFGSTTNPRIGVRYVPLDGLTVRGSWGKSFKAPTFAQMNLPTTVLLWNAATLGSGGPGTALYRFGGNPDLDPERSTSWTIGFDWAPTSVDGLDISATYFKIDYTDRVVSPILSQGTALSDPVHEPFLVRSPTLAQQADLVAGASQFVNVTANPYDATRVVAIVNGSYVNASAQKVEGIDLSVTKSLEFGKGTLDAFANASWMKLSQKTIPGAPTVTLSGTLFYPAETRIRSGLSWRSGEFTTTAAVNYVAGGTDNVAFPAAHIDPWTTLDLTVRYRMPAWSPTVPGLEATLSVTNATDEDPPYAAGGGIGLSGMNFDSTNASPIGRFVAVTLRQSF